MSPDRRKFKISPYHRRKARERMMELRHGPHWREILDRAGHRCERCGGTEDIHIDHIIPVAKGGDRFAEDNQQVLCSKCNQKKMVADFHPYPPILFRRELKRQNGHLRAIGREA